MPKKYFSSKTFKLILVIAICLLLVFWNPKNIFYPIRGFFLKITYPFQKTAYIVSKKTGDFFELISSISDFKSENERLLRENNSLLAQLASLSDQKKENENLRIQLDLAPRDKYKLSAALVIGQDPNSQGSWLIVDKGSSDGIEVGMPAIVSDGILVGKVKEVFADSAKIVLLTDSSSLINVVDIETGAKGILSGEYSLGLAMNMVERTDVLNIGDDVITSGLGGSTQRGFLVGKISQVNNTNDKLFQQAIIVPKIKYSNLDFVFIVKGMN